MGVQNLASVHVEPAAVFYFSRKAGAKPFPKQKFIKKIRLKTSAHRHVLTRDLIESALQNHSTWHPLVG